MVNGNVTGVSEGDRQNRIEEMFEVITKKNLAGTVTQIYSSLNDYVL